MPTHIMNKYRRDPAVKFWRCDFDTGDRAYVRFTSSWYFAAMYIHFVIIVINISFYIDTS
jgi:hypothetical protein